MFKPDMIVIHHSATRDSGTVSWDAIRQYHMTKMNPPMRDIGYHAGTELVGKIFVGQMGRALDTPGAHTKHHNAHSLGFCFVGDYDKAVPDETMLVLAAQFVLAPWCRKFAIPVDRIRPHSEFAAKTCPGLLFPVEHLRDLVRAELG